MLDINQYEYTKDPYDKSDKFVVHPLNEDGVRTYYSKEAHTHTFLDRLNPRLMNKIHEDKQNLDRYYQTILEERFSANNIEEKEKLKSVKISDQNQDGNEGWGNDATGINRPTAQDKFNYQYQQNQSQSYSNYKQTKPFRQAKAKSIPPQKLDEKLASFGKTTFGKRIQPFITNTQSKSLSRYNMSEDSINPKSNSFYQRPFKKIGFESYNIPRVESKRLKPVQVIQYESKCFKSFASFYSTAKDNFTEHLSLENDRLTNILLNQTSEGFLKANKLPKISYIINQPEIVVKKTGIGNSKFMGQNYNPYNFNPTSHKNMTKRNVNGTLYLH